MAICVLEFWQKLTERVGIYKLSAAERQQLFHGCVDMLKTCAATHLGMWMSRMSGTGDDDNFVPLLPGHKFQRPEQETIIHDDIYVILRILSNVISSDFADYFGML